MMNRRSLLTLASAGAALSATRLWAAPRAGSKLLVVFLRGAYDAASLLVPTASDFYYEARPNIAIPRPGSGPGAAIPLDGHPFALHPALEHSLLPLYQRRQLAFVPFAGTANLSRSHFETQTWIELGRGEPDGPAFNSGFMTRLARELEGSRAISFAAAPPVAFQGDASVASAEVAAVRTRAISGERALQLAALYRDDALLGAVRSGLDAKADLSRVLSAEAMAAQGGATTAKGFSRQARRIAQMMQGGGYDLAFTDVGGWDTHIDQGGAQGVLSQRLGDLGNGLAAFAGEIGPAWDRTVVVVVSEFGRTFRENGDRGTDHGHGTVFWVMGGGVSGGVLAGDQAEVAPGKLFQDRDYPVLNEYRTVLGGLFQRLYGLDQTRLDRVFPGAAARDLHLV